MAEITIAVAALAGLGSFLAPCILPVIPAFLAYISGTTITDLQRTKGSMNMLITRLNIFLNTVFFVLGFSIVFSVFGILLNSVLASSATGLTSSFNQVGGIIIVGFGGFMLLSTRIGRLNFEKKIIPTVGKAS
ncbi:MAG: cytochrome c biogenesis CcdA family protein, partial [Candidatus Nitrosotenuis sp.]